MVMSGNFEVLWFDQRCQGDREVPQPLSWSHLSFHTAGPGRETPDIKEVLKLPIEINTLLALPYWKFKGLAVPSDFSEIW